MPINWRVTMYKKAGVHCEEAVSLLTEKYGLEITFVDVEDAERQGEILHQMRSFSRAQHGASDLLQCRSHWRQR